MWDFVCLLRGSCPSVCCRASLCKFLHWGITSQLSSTNLIQNPVCFCLCKCGSNTAWNKGLYPSVLVIVVKQSAFAHVTSFLWDCLLVLQCHGISNTWVLVVFEFYWRASIGQTNSIKVLKKVWLSYCSLNSFGYCAEPDICKTNNWWIVLIAKSYINSWSVT